MLRAYYSSTSKPDKDPMASWKVSLVYLSRVRKYGASVSDDNEAVPPSRLAAAGPSLRRASFI